MRLVTTQLGTHHPTSRPDIMRVITIQDTTQASFDTIAGYLN